MNRHFSQSAARKEKIRLLTTKSYTTRKKPAIQSRSYDQSLNNSKIYSNSIAPHPKLNFCDDSHKVLNLMPKQYIYRGYILSAFFPFALLLLLLLHRKGYS